MIGHVLAGVDYLPAYSSEPVISLLGKTLRSQFLCVILPEFLSYASMLFRMLAGIVLTAEYNFMGDRLPFQISSLSSLVCFYLQWANDINP